MPIELKVPSVGESITEAMIGEWLKAEGDWIPQDEPVVVIETDKVNVEIPAPESGYLKEIVKKEGESAEIGDVVGYMEPAEKPDDGDEASKDEASKDEASKDEASKDEASKDEASKDEASKDAKDEEGEETEDQPTEEPRVTPAARRVLAEAGLEASDVEATGKGGRVLKEDVLRHVEKSESEQETEEDSREEKESAREEKESAREEKESAREEKEPRASASSSRREEAVRMTPLRRRVAERLVAAQQNAALLTTFNEIDMSAVIELRKKYKEAFLEKYDVKLGFMSFFVKAAIEALKEIPGVNAEIRGDEIVYHDYYDIGVAVGGGKGLVVPVVRNAERLSFAEVEKTIGDLASRALSGKLKLEELQGGTFTISNGGVYGSLLSTPIVNPPQSGILGLHKIEERPVAVDGQVVVRPMMYVALTYDHRVVDGREAVTFLVKLKERIEDPSRILLEV